MVPRSSVVLALTACGTTEAAPCNQQVATLASQNIIVNVLLNYTPQMATLITPCDTQLLGMGGGAIVSAPTNCIPGAATAPLCDGVATVICGNGVVQSVSLSWTSDHGCTVTPSAVDVCQGGYGSCVTSDAGAVDTADAL
jgi:hypothetical protein